MAEDLRLYIVEGGRNTIKNEFLGELANQGVQVVRGMVSQEDNSGLVPEAQELVADLDLDFGRALTLPVEDGVNLMQCCIKVSQLQFNEAIRIASNGVTTCLDSSVIRLIALNNVAARVAIKHGDEELADWAFSMANKARNKSAMAGVRGLVLVTKPNLDDNSDNPMLPFDEDELFFLRQAVSDIQRDQKVRVLKIDSDTLTLEDEVERFKSFAGLNTPVYQEIS